MCLVYYRSHKDQPSRRVQIWSLQQCESMELSCICCLKRKVHQESRKSAHDTIWTIIVWYYSKSFKLHVPQSESVEQYSRTKSPQVDNEIQSPLTVDKQIRLSDNITYPQSHKFCKFHWNDTMHSVIRTSYVIRGLKHDR